MTLAPPLRRRHGSVFAVAASLLSFTLALPASPLAAVNQWTPWLNRDDPGGSGDFETLRDFVASGQACAAPLAVECRTRDGRPWQEVGQVMTCNRTEGAYCLYARQPAGQRCLDYEVRFLCPVEMARPAAEIPSHALGPGPDFRPMPAPRSTPDVVIEQASGALLVTVVPGVAVEGLRVIVSPQKAALVSAAQLPPGWSLRGGDPGGAFTFAGNPTEGAQILLPLREGSQPPSVRVALRRAGPPGSRGFKGQPQTLGTTIAVPELNPDCDCKTVPCPQVAAFYHGGTLGADSSPGRSPKGNQLLGGADPMQGLNVAKTEKSCYECVCK